MTVAPLAPARRGADDPGLYPAPGGTSGVAAAGYGWLGAHQRTVTSIGIVLMGSRLYNAATGLFTSIDPVWGGNETVYGYPNDPVNKQDTTGLKSFFSKVKKGIVSLANNRVVQGVCFVAFGAVGTACAILSAASNIINKNWTGLAGDIVGGVAGRAAGKAFVKSYNKVRSVYNKETKRLARSGNPRTRKMAASRDVRTVYSKRYRYFGKELSSWAAGTFGAVVGTGLTDNYKRSLATKRKVVRR